MCIQDVLAHARDASRQLALIPGDVKDGILRSMADGLEAFSGELLAANAADLSRMDRSDPLYDRMELTPARIGDIACGLRRVAGLPSPLGRVTGARTLPNGLRLRRVSVPYGVIGVIFEARPNVAFDVSALCLKAGSACVLKGGKDADNSNRAIEGYIRDVLQAHGVSKHAVSLLPSTHEATAGLLSAVGYVDLCIPRGGKRLIDFVREEAKVPVIETGAGVVNTYFDEFGDVEMGARIINNAKTRRVSVCNALDCLIIHRSRLADLPALCAPLAGCGVTVHADDEAFAALGGRYPEGLLRHATAESYGTEFMSYALAVRTVGTLGEAMEHIARYGSGHSECIITQDAGRAAEFEARVDAACVYWNAPTSFTDGGQFGLGAEIGISTQKLGPRGPMGLEELTTYKWIIEGEGQVRE